MRGTRIRPVTITEQTEDITETVSGLVEDKQDELVSGTNIKSINGISLLGSGDITIGGGTFSGDMDDIPDGALHVKTENNYTDADKAKVDAIDQAFTSAEKSKLSGIATGATANSSDATLLARANHTGTQSADTITDGSTNKAYTAAEKTKLAAITGTNTGDQISIVGISGTKSQFNTSCSDGDFMFVGDAVSLSQTSAFASVTTTVSTATYMDITGCSVSLAAGTWIIFAHVVASAANAIIQCFGAITHNDNTVISESANSRPASGTASLNSPISFSWFAIVTPASTTTYKLRGARGLTTHTGSWTSMNGNGVNTANHASNNSNKGTGIFAVRIA